MSRVFGTTAGVQPCCRSWTPGHITVRARRARAQPPKRAAPRQVVLPPEDTAGAALRAWLAKWKHDDCGVQLSRLDGDHGCDTRVCARSA